MCRWIGGLIGILTISLSSVTNVSAASVAATLSASPTASSVITGENVGVAVKINTAGQAASYVTVSLGYSTNLEYLSADATGSVFSTEVIAPSSANPLSFERTRLDAGYTGDNGVVLTLLFRAKTAGTASITVNKSVSEVLAYEDSSDILASTQNASLTIIEPTPTPAASSTPAGAGATAAPSAKNSLIESSTACAVSNGQDAAVVRVTTKDANNRTLTDTASKPSGTLSAKKTAKATVQLQGDKWEIKVTDSVEETVTVTIVSKGVTLGKLDLKFAASCPSPETTADLTVTSTPEPFVFPPDVYSPIPLLPENPQPPTRVLGIVVMSGFGLIALSGLIYLAWNRARRKSPQAEEGFDPVAHGTPPVGKFLAPQIPPPPSQAPPTSPPDLPPLPSSSEPPPESDLPEK